MDEARLTNHKHRLVDRTGLDDGADDNDDAPDPHGDTATKLGAHPLGDKAHRDAGQEEH
jgi:hypothetical protein